MSQNTRRLLFLVASVTVVTLGHYVTSLHIHQAHDLYRRLYYLPIIFAGFWYGLRGGLVTSIVVALVFFPHVWFQWRETPFIRAEQYLEMLLYVIVGGLTGGLSQKEAQRREELHAANHKLEEAFAQLREQSLALVQAEEQLRRADRLAALGELSAGMAHEIRNPLGSIKGTAEIFRDSLPSEHKLHEFASILVKETDRLDGILTHFLEFARPKELNAGRSDPAAVVADVVGLARERARRAKVEVETQLDPGLPSVAMPGDALRQVTLNLVLNGIQAMSGTGRLVITAREGPPRRLERPEQPVAGRVVHLAVTDTGPGIPVEVQDRIFDPFFTTKRTGTGLGLAICQRIVLGYRGVIYFEPGEPSGARFVAELPVANGEG
ncbi:MAG TPA: ATP-binding protein [Polyangia bacterium]|jgi:signal transduction histidine kinase